MLLKQTSHGIPIRKHYFSTPARYGWRDVVLPTAYFDCLNFPPEKAPKWFSAERRHTLLTDLRADEAAIFQNFSKDTRNQIRRSEKTGILNLNVHGDATQFVTLFQQFARMRQLSAFSVEEIQAFGKDNHCLLSMDKAGQAVISHLYLLSPETGIASILASVSDQQYNTDPEMRRLIGHANRSLHWQGMRHLKAMGYHTYDWCGYALDTNDPVLQGINRFKRTFNGTLTPVYNFYSPTYAFIETLRKKLRELRSNRKFS